jgi:superfamily II DNA or RNA helicase
MNRFSKFKYNTKKETKETFKLTEDYKNTICIASYLGKKGYTIPKTLLAKEDEEYLRKELFVKPEVAGANYGNQSDENAAFPVFRENSNKLYLPRFYGIHRYGLPPRSEIAQGEDINVTFTKPLRDYQDKIIDIYTKYVTTPICSGSELVGSGGILEVPCGAGKTVMALKIISNIKKKTLIIVHKEFLMNQWIERIAEFLPGALVGKIQGQVFDIEGKDIVIGMVQTLYDKEFNGDAFSKFGLTIIDEVHRIGSEQFSRTLFKTITPYMLGISATVERKDKLTKVLYMFIGDKIYSQERESDDLVSVRAIHYVANDTEFNEVERDFRGNPKYSTMISKLCSYGPRSDFIIKVVGDLLKEDCEKQIMILCHNRSLLTYLYEGITHRDLASVGYYVGGMKQIKLQETEQKQIVLATYAMAAEALDIKTLSSLIMVTPKTDIIQSVGRILRVKHENPIVVDIVDKHDIFQNQWAQRRRFYKKCNYRIRQIDSLNYKGMALDWTNDQTWKRVYEPKSSTTCNVSAAITDEQVESDEEDKDKSTYLTPIKGSDKGKCLIDINEDEFE